MAFDLARAIRSQKAIPDHPVFHDNVPVSVYAPGASRQDAKLSQREAPRHMEAYGGPQSMDYVMDACNLYADTTSTAAWHLSKDGVPLVRKKDKTTPPEYEEGPSALYALLDQPNEHMLYDELMALMVIDLLLVGNAYWLKWMPDDLGRPAAIFRLAPQFVKIIPGAFGPKKYEYQPKGARDPLKFGPEEVVHVRRPNPNDAYYGMGVIKGGGRWFDGELALTETMVSYYENKADPSLIVQSDRRVPRDVFNKLRAQLRGRTAGPHQAGALLVLEAGLKASTLSPSARDAMFDELSGMSRNRIFAMFRASPKLFGYLDGTGSDKVSDARREFDTFVMRPFMDKLQRKLSFGLTRAWGVDFEIDYRYTMALEDLIKNVGLAAAIPGIKVREVRRLAGPLGIPESTGDREIDETVLNMPMPELDANGQGGGADRNLPGEAGRPPKGSNTTSFKQAQNRAGAKAFADIEAEFKALNTAGERVTVGNKLPDEVRPSDPFESDRGRDIEDVAGVIQDGLSDALHLLERELLDHVEGKAFKPNNLRSRLRNSPAWKTFSERVEAVLTDAARRAASRAVMQSGMTPEDELDYDALAKSVVHRPEGVRGIVRTLKNRLLARLGDKITADATQQEVQAELQSFVAEWTADDGWVRTIGLSEAVESYNEGTLSVAEAMGVQNVFVTDGDDQDQPCVDANGSTWTLEQARANVKEHPRCRRAFLLPSTA